MPISAAKSKYVERELDSQIAATLAELPGVLILGPRAVGKTTTARRHARSVVQLDREAGAFRSDPDSALQGLEEPILIDEWQAVPEILGAIKRSIDQDSRPGRFIVTGSVRARLEATTWPGTGRLVTLKMYGLTWREQLGRLESPSFLNTLLSGAAPVVEPLADTPDLRGYVEMALRSGFPDPALRLSGEAGLRWLRGYVDQLVTRDAEMVSKGRDPNRMRRFLQAYGAVTAQVTEDKTIYEAAGVDRKTMLAYEQLMTNLFVVDQVPAWWTNRLKRLVHRPKRYLVDAGMAAVLLPTSVDSLMRDGALVGPLLETFVVSQLRGALASSWPHIQLHHLRDEGGRHEVDAIVELENGDVAAFEIKADSAVTSKDARHLIWLRDELKGRFHSGVVFHTGPRSYELADRIAAVPIAALWS